MEEELIWSNECDNQIKNLFISNRVLANFISKLPLKLTVDESSIAVGAILSHVYSENTERLITFALHLLTKAEQKYPQLERKELVVKKFHNFLFGKLFTL